MIASFPKYVFLFWNYYHCIFYYGTCQLFLYIFFSFLELYLIFYYGTFTIIIMGEFKMIKRLRELREEMNLTQNDICKVLGITRSNVSKYESGALDPSTDVLNSYANYFDCTIDYILGRTNDRKHKMQLADEYSAVVTSAKNANVSPKVLSDYIEFLHNQIQKKS